MLRLFWILLTIGLMSYADTADLEKLVVELGKRPQVVNPTPLPVLNFNNTDFRLPLANNIFDSQRANESTTNLFQNFETNYSLNQVQMVGYMRYENVNYAMLKTPYETIKVKVGDQVKSGKVVQISETMTEIDEVMLAEGKSYIKKRYFNLTQTNNRKQPALNLK